MEFNFVGCAIKVTVPIMSMGRHGPAKSSLDLQLPDLRADAAEVEALPAFRFLASVKQSGREHFYLAG